MGSYSIGKKGLEPTIAERRGPGIPPEKITNHTTSKINYVLFILMPAFNKQPFKKKRT